MSSEKFPIDAKWATTKVVFIEKDFAQIKNSYPCALAVDPKNGSEFFLAQKLYTKSGDTYVLEKYDSEKQTVFYRRKK